MVLSAEEKIKRKQIANAKAYAKRKQKQSLQRKIKITKNKLDEANKQIEYHLHQLEHYGTIKSVYEKFGMVEGQERINNNNLSLEEPIQMKIDESPLESPIENPAVDFNTDALDKDPYIEFEHYNKIYYYDSQDLNFYDIETDEKLGKVVLVKNEVNDLIFDD